jgi:hypothetical protein
MKLPPNPGSLEAIVRGCTCPPNANNGGKGIAGLPDKYYWIGNECPLHPAPEGWENHLPVLKDTE